MVATKEKKGFCITERRKDAWIWPELACSAEHGKLTGTTNQLLQAAVLLVIEIEQGNGEGKRRGRLRQERTLEECAGGAASPTGDCEFVGVCTASVAPPHPRDSSPLPRARSGCAGLGNFISLCVCALWRAVG